MEKKNKKKEIALIIRVKVPFTYTLEDIKNNSFLTRSKTKRIMFNIQYRGKRKKYKCFVIFNNNKKNINELKLFKAFYYTPFRLLGRQIYFKYIVLFFI